ncbi:hypothetical protein [Hyphobacterium marinum]|uniref:Nicotinamide riboside transporter PnuC n=1 Tax=Hyphobacterium marinum TaxID=3116574 RepID=A0ABU7LZZ1_9PROT|nr:hypothetical protein [Hyphobacterium sp. Y6023]MEE2567016.1 hypothetical protein [Hyphobacterium sp. Y6023]
MLDETVRWAAAISGIVAALMIAGRFGGRITGWGFALFTLSSIAWITAGWLDDTWSLMVQNLVLFGINLLGVWRWLIKHEG